jgi:glutamine synthetase
MNAKFESNMNQIVHFLEKEPQDFTKEDLIRFIEQREIQMLNFRCLGGDGRLKTLNFVIASKGQLDRLLSAGERVDGSNLLPYIDAASSDLYIIPRYRTAYVNPFSAAPTVDILCSYYTNEGTRLSSSPENVVKKAHEVLKNSTGLTLEAMGELEYYVVFDSEGLYPTMAQKGYQESPPFSRWERLRCEAMRAIAQAGGRIKYGHAEVGHIQEEHQEMEQHEIEFLPVPIEEAADQIVIARWMLRMIGHRHGVTISFAPKIALGHAGSGLHIHTRLVRNGENVMIEGNRLSDVAKKAIAGYLTLARSLTAFGNTVPISFLRLVPNQEAPTNVCWSDRNRSALVRVPLGWLNVKHMITDANPQASEASSENWDSQTVEFRCPDGCANIHLTLAGLAVAARHGLQMEDALKLSSELYVDVDIFCPEHRRIQERLPRLPTSCWESAENLLEDRRFYERDDVFPPLVIDGLARTLKGYDDKNLSKRLRGDPDEIKKLVGEHIHCS